MITELQQYPSSVYAMPIIDVEQNITNKHSCCNCGKLFRRAKRDMPKGKLIYCSTQCYRDYCNSVQMPGTIKLLSNLRVIRRYDFENKGELKKQMRVWEKEFAGIEGYFMIEVIFDERQNQIIL